MKKFPLAALAIISMFEVSHARVIYGEDNRVELSEATPFQQRFAQAAASMIPAERMTLDPALGTAQIQQETLRDWLDSQFEKSRNGVQTKFTDMASQGITFCPGERFVDQPNPSRCSGFLIAPDLIVTAGHCAELPNFCSDYKWVFGFQMDPETNTAGLDMSVDDVYSCKEVISTAFVTALNLDYAVVRLDRRVKKRVPLEIRNQGKVKDRTPLFIVGSPSGLPLKVADGAQVNENAHPHFFKSNLDSFQGNSGSGVFNATTGAIEGILVRGEDDFVPNRRLMCVETKKCVSNECKGEDVLRMTVIPEVGVQEALYLASETGNVEILEKLLRLPFWIDFYTKDGQSALMKASAKAQKRTMALLLGRGADVNLQDAGGYSALHHLAKVLDKDSELALQLLLDAKIDVTLKNDKGETALDLARTVNPVGAEILSSHLEGR